MHPLILIPFLVGGLAVIPATAAAVRTLAFELPATTVTFEIKAADSSSGTPAKLQIEAGRNQFTAPVKLPAGRYVASSKAFNAPVEFTLPDSSDTRFLLLILPRPDGSCAILPIPDDIRKIGPGDRFLLNATGEEIAVRFGTRRSTVKPGHSVYLHPPQPAPKDRRIEVEMVRRVGAAWVPFNSTYWPLDPTARSFVLVHPDPVTGTPRVRNLSEVP